MRMHTASFSMERILYFDADYMRTLSIDRSNNWTHVSPFYNSAMGGCRKTNCEVRSLLLLTTRTHANAGRSQLQLPGSDKGIEPQNHTSLGPPLLWIGVEPCQDAGGDWDNSFALVIR